MVKKRLPEIPRDLKNEDAMRKYMEIVADTVNYQEPTIAALTGTPTLPQVVTKVNQIIAALKNARIIKTA